MKKGFTGGLLALVAVGAFANPILVNTLSTRPVFTVTAEQGVTTRTVAPGNKVALEAGRFSGLGEKNLALEDGIYYLAVFGALPHLYRLAPDQALVLNQAGRPVDLALEGERSAQGILAVGAFGLGATSAAHPLKATWTDGSGRVQSAELQGGIVYRLVLDSPEGLGTTISLKPWD